MSDSAIGQELVKVAQLGVEQALAAGANDAFVHATRRRSVDFEARNGALERVTEATTRGLSVEVWVDGRFGSSSTTDLRPDALSAFIRDAVALTRALAPDPDRRITDPALYGGRTAADLQLADPAVTGIERERRLELLAAMAAPVLGKERVISAACATSDDHVVAASVSSNGFQGVQEETSQWLSTGVTLRDEGDRRPEGGMDGGGRFVADLPDPQWVGAEALAWANARLGSVKGPTRKTVMIVHPRAAGRLIGALLSAADGGSLQQKRSFWGPIRGKTVVSRKLTVTDQPHLPRGFGSRRWDREGIASRPLPVLVEGALVNAYIDTTYARKLGEPPTTGGPSNRVVTPGKRDLNAILRDVSDGIYVTSWLGGNMNGTTGDFSYGLRGHVVRKGKIGESIGETNITGNVLTLFAGLAEVGNDPWKYTTTLCPTLVFDGVQFS
jgi:PmbA protein